MSEISGRRMTGLTVAWLLFISLAGLTGCADVEKELLPLPAPDLSSLRAEVAEQLGRRRANLQALAGSAAADKAGLGIEFGEMGKLYHAYDMREAARDCYINATLLRPDDYRWHYYLGQVESAAGNVAAAMKALQTAHELNTGYRAAGIALAKLYYESGDAERAGRLLGQLREKSPDAVSSYYLGQLAFDEGDYQRAAGYFEEALKAQPSATRINYSLSQAYQALGDHELAATYLARRGSGRLSVSDPLMLALGKLTLGARRHLDQGAAAFRNRNYALAKSHFEKAVAAEPDNVSARQNLASAFVKLGQAAEAVEQYELALRLDPDYLPAHFSLALVLGFQGEHEKALGHFRVVEQSDPNYRSLGPNLGVTLAALGRCDEAAPYLERALANDPDKQAVRAALETCEASAEGGKP